jgi:hypothetical protein
VLVELSVMEQRYKAVLAVVQDGWRVVEVARRLGVTRQTVHTWIARYEQGGLGAGLGVGRRPRVHRRRLTLLSGEGISIALFVAVVLSNIPESMAATSGLAASGVSSSRILAMWASVTVISGLAAMAGYGLLGSAPPGLVAFVQAFAAGAVLTMLADTMMPEAFEHARQIAGLAATLGFVVAFGIAQLEKAA